MWKIFKWQTIILTFIIFLALGLRIYKLNNIPAGFHQDEVVNAYVGKFVLKNGVDLYGNKFPLLYFDKWGDYPPVLPMYINGLGSLIFGDTVFGARIFPVLLGVLTIFNIFLLSLKIFKNKSEALFSALILAINPWHIAFSRVGSEGIIAAFFYTLALVFFAYKKNIHIIFFFLTYLLYPGFRIVIPLTFAGLLIFDYLENKKISKPLLVSLFFSVLLTLGISRTSWGQSRFDQTSIINYVNSQKEYFNKFIYNENSVLVARIFNNKLIFIVQEFLRQFLSYFSPVFLFIEGGRPSWFSFPNSGLFYLSSLFFIIVAFTNFLRKNSKFLRNWFYLIIYLLMVAVVPAALTNEHSPNMHRSLLMVIFISLVIGYGFWIIKNMKLKIIILVFLGIVMVGEFIYFTHNYFQHVSMYTSIARSDGNQQTGLYLKDQRAKYNKVYMMASGWFPIYYLYFSGNYNRNLIGKIQNGMRIDTLDNITFLNKDCPSIDNNFNDFVSQKGQNLVIFSTTCALPADPRSKKINTIINSSRIPIYHVFETTNQ